MPRSFFERLTDIGLKSEKNSIVVSIIFFTVIGGVIGSIFSLWLIPVGLILGGFLGIRKSRGRLIRIRK